MKKILFDTSILLGQFCINDDKLRIACKNSQVDVSKKPESGIVGVVSFNENSWSDHIVWGLKREMQDFFFKFMDVLHSLKNINRVALSQNDAKLAIEISEKLGLDISNALSCAVAITQNAHKIHTFYPSFVTTNVTSFVKKHYGIEISSPTADAELRYRESNLEKYYQDALMTFKTGAIDLKEMFHK